jgi:hypothetical protein
MTSENPNTAERNVRDGAPPNDGPLGGLPGPSAEIDRDAPTGMPTDEHDVPPLGPDEARPEDEGEHGEEHMPGIPTGGEPPTAG